MTIVQLEDLSDRLLRPYSGMTDGQLRRGEGFRRDNPHGLFIGESGRVIERALDSGVRPVSVLVEERWLEHDRAIVERIRHELRQHGCDFPLGGSAWDGRRARHAGVPRSVLSPMRPREHGRRVPSALGEDRNRRRNCGAWTIERFVRLGYCACAPIAGSRFHYSCHGAARGFNWPARPASWGC